MLGPPCSNSANPPIQPIAGTSGGRRLDAGAQVGERQDHAEGREQEDHEAFLPAVQALRPPAVQELRQAVGMDQDAGHAGAPGEADVEGGQVVVLQGEVGADQHDLAGKPRVGHQRNRLRRIGRKRRRHPVRVAIVGERQKVTARHLDADGPRQRGGQARRGAARLAGFQQNRAHLAVEPVLGQHRERGIDAA